MEQVFTLRHIHTVGDDDDEKLIGIYKTREDAEAPLNVYGTSVGSRMRLRGFEIHEYELGRDGWTEGYISIAEVMQSKDP